MCSWYISRLSIKSIPHADIRMCVQRRADEVERRFSDVDATALTLTQELESARADLHSTQESAEQLSSLKSQLDDITTDRDAQKSGKEAAEEEARELRQAVQESEAEVKSMKKEAKTAHASIDSLSQEASRLSTACQESADRSTGMLLIPLQ